MFSVFVSVAVSSAQFIGKLRNKEATEGTMATLRCELTKEAPVEWKKGTETLRNGDKYTLKQDGAVCELQICSLLVADAGEYLCVCGQEKTSATLTVKGKEHLWLPPTPVNLLCIPPYFLSHYIYMNQKTPAPAAGFPLLSAGRFFLVAMLCSVLFLILSYVTFYLPTLCSRSDAPIFVSPS